MAKVHSLPFEILLDIFRETSADIQHAYVANLGALPSSTERNYPYSWIRVTHVNRVWRTVALSSPTLWSTVILINSIATKQFLQRAESQLLTIIFDVSGTMSPDTVEDRLTTFEWLLAEMTDRMEALVMPASPVHLTEDFAKRATNLRTLKLSNPFLEDEDANFTVRLPFPALEHLSIVTIPRTPVTGLLVSTLKTLVLLPKWDGFGCDCPGGLIALPTTKDLLFALSDMPHLEKLHLEVDDEIVETDIVARLPKLKDLRLDGSSTPAAYVFRHLDVPPNVTFTFNRRIGRAEPAIVLLVNDTIRQSIVDPAWLGIDYTRFSPILSCKVSWRRDFGDYMIKGWREIEAGDDARRGRRGSADVELHFITFEPRVVLTTFLALFCFDTVQELEIGRMPWHLLDVDECCAALASGTSLRSLTLDNFDGTSALKALTVTAAKDIVLRRIGFNSGSMPDREHTCLR